MLNNKEPKTISVSKPIQIPGSNKNSISWYPHFELYPLFYADLRSATDP